MIVAVLLVMVAAALVFLGRPQDAANDDVAVLAPVCSSVVEAATHAPDLKSDDTSRSAQPLHAPFVVASRAVDALNAVTNAGSARATADGAAPASAWRGVVVDADGAPLAGARVGRLPAQITFNFIAGPSATNPTLFADATWTDTGADGSFELPWARPDKDNMRWDVVVIGAGHVPRLVQCEDALLEGGDLGTLALRRGATLTARLLEADDTPVVGATVTASLGPFGVRPFTGAPPPPLGLNEALLQVRTGDDGRFTLAGLPGADVSLHIKAVGHEDLELPVQTLAAEGALDLGDLRMSRGGRVSGRVLDVLGAPIAGAEVRASISGLETLKLFEHGVHYELASARSGITTGIDRYSLHEAAACVTATDADGRFTIDGLVKPMCAVIAVAPGYEPVAAGEFPIGTSGIELRLQRLGMLHVRIVDDADGSPLEDATLSLVRRLGSDANSEDDLGEAIVVERSGPGEFIAHGICDTSFLALVRSPALGLAFVPLDGLPFGQLPAEASVVVRVPRAASIEGRVVTSAGESVPKARVTLAPGSYAQCFGKVREVILPVDREGRFASGPLPAGRWVLTASAKGLHVEALDLTLVPGQSESDVSLRLCREVSLSVLQLDAAGQPVVGAQLNVVNAARPAGGADVLGWRSTDATGRAEFSVPAGALRLEQRKPPLVVELGVLAEGEQRVLTLQQPRAAVLQGTVRAAASPVAGAVVSFTHAMGLVHTTTDGAGRYRLEIPGDMSGRVRAVSPRGGFAVRQLDTPAGATLDVDLDFGDLVLHGTVIDVVTGEGVAGLSFLVSGPSDSPFVPSVKSDATGRFTLEHFDAGTWTIGVRGDDITTTEPVAVTLPAAQDLVVRVVRTGSVSGVVRQAQGFPAASFHSVYLLGADSAENADLNWAAPGSAAAPDGAFRFTGVAPGDYVLCVTRPMHRGGPGRDVIEALAWTRATVHVSSGADTQQDLVLPAGMP